MSTYEGSIKTGHPVAAIVLGIIGILIALALTLLFGAIAGGIALLLGVLAILLGVGARKGGRGGMGGIITGALAVVLAVAMTFTISSSLKEMQRIALETGKAPLFAETFDNPWLGLSGPVFKLANDPDKLNALTKEMDALRSENAETASQTAVTETVSE